MYGGFFFFFVTFVSNANTQCWAGSRTVIGGNTVVVENHLLYKQEVLKPWFPTFLSQPNEVGTADLDLRGLVHKVNFHNKTPDDLFIIFCSEN